MSCECMNASEVESDIIMYYEAPNLKLRVQDKVANHKIDFEFYTHHYFRYSPYYGF